MSWSSHPDREGFVEFEGWGIAGGRGRQGTTATPISENEAADQEQDQALHPLQIPNVLEKVFSHLVSSLRDHVERKDPSKESKHLLTSARNLRQVCKTWNIEMIRILSSRYSCHTSLEVENLYHLHISPSSPAPFIRELSLRYSNLWRIPDTYRLILSLQGSLKVLELAAIDLDFSAWILLSTVCPTIQKLEITCADIFPDVSFEGLEPFEEMWGNPFPSLKEVKFSQGSLTINGAKVLLLILDRSKNVDSLVLRSEDFAGHGQWGSAGGRRYSQRNENAMQFFVEGVAGNCSLLRRLKNLKVDNPNSAIFIDGLNMIAPTLRTKIGMALQTLSIIQRTRGFHKPIGSISLGTTVSKIVEQMAPFLRRLTIVNSSDSLGLLRGRDALIGKVLFPPVLPRLEYLCLGNVTIGLKGDPSSPRYPGFSQVFPSLDHFELWIRIFNDMPEMEKNVLFYETLFPDTANMSQKRIRDFHIYTRYNIGHERVFDKMVATFPFLSSLLLEIDGELLSAVVKKFAPLPIQSFTLIYYETPNPVDFVVAATGIPRIVCDALLTHAEENKDSLCPYQEYEDLKDGPSFGDWKELTRLNISYRHGGHVDVVFLMYGLCPIMKLKHLELRHFDVKDNLLIRMIKRLDLETLTLGNCRVIPMNPDFPVIDYDWGVADIVHFYGKETRVDIVGFDADGETEGTPYYAKLLHHFDYDNPDWVAG